MSTTDPIKDENMVKYFLKYYRDKGNTRNYCLISLGLHTALRIGDLLSLKWKDVYDFKTEMFNKHIALYEMKTGKKNVIALNDRVIEDLKLLKDRTVYITKDGYIFRSRKGENIPISRKQAFRIIKQAAEDLNIEGNISCHSLRKTFGYSVWKKGVQPAIIMKIFNHSSYEITKRYLCIDQDDTDEVFKNISY